MDAEGLAETASDVEMRQKAARTRRSNRRSSLMYEYYRDNYMNLKEVTEKQIKDMHEAFELLDTDHDGRLTKREFETLVRFTGVLMSDRELEEMLSPIDVNHNGFIDFDEFEKYVVNNKILEKMADETCYEMEAAFKMFDKDGDGFIDKQELMAVLTQIGDKMPAELAEDFIREADINGDGKIDYLEFCKHMGY